MQQDLKALLIDPEFSINTFLKEILDDKKSVNCDLWLKWLLICF